MKIRNMLMSAGAAAALAPVAIMADTSTVNTATPDPMQSQVQTHLRMDIKEDVKEVHFINTNADPYVYTKIYILKSADPYELRPYLIGAIGGKWGTDNTYSTSGQGRRVDDNPTRVECIKHMDGVGAMIVSAEDYRFTKGGNESGMSIDEIINILDQPNITSSSSHIFELYFPKYNTAAELETSIKRVGLNGAAPGVLSGDQWELANGRDSVRKDNYLNALLFYVPDYSVKQYQQMLVQYDKPTPEVVVNYTVYEYDNEIDSQVGSDFQAWKNGPGQDLFAIGGRFTNGWDINQMNVARSNAVSSNSAKYMNFNPKWNTKYLDLLASKSYAQVVTSGSLSLFNNKVGIVGSTVSYPTIADGVTKDASGITQVRSYTAANVSNSTSGVSNGAATTNKTFKISSAVTRNNVYVHSNLFGSSYTGTDNFTVYEYQRTCYDGNGSKVVDYYYEIVSDVAVVDVNGNSLGTDVIIMAPSVGGQITLSKYDATLLPGSSNTSNGYVAASFSTTSTEPTAFAMENAPTRVSTIKSNGSASSYGFQLQIGAAANGNAPVLTVCETTTTVPITMTNTNLIGFNSDGTPRTSSSKVSTVVVANNKGERFVIGGLNKEQVIRSAAKVPYIGDIPGLGWVVGNERETHKKSQLVAVIDVIPVVPETGVAAGIMGQIAKDKEFISNYGVKNSIIDENDYGYDQFLLDSDKKSFDPLP
jgi:general secretion pathway protein D